MQSTEPRNVKTTDDLVLNATSIAEENYEVEYEFTIKEINKTLTTTGNTNSIATVNFGKLTYGTYTAVISGKYGTYEDTIEYTFNVVKSAQEVKNKQTVNINNQTTIKPTKNPIVLEIYNKNIEKYLEYIDFIESTVTERLDTQIVNYEIQNIKNRYYNTETTSNYINIENYNDDIFLRNLPNGAQDIILTALVNKYSEKYSIHTYFETIPDDANIYEIYLLASANNEAVLTDLLYLKQDENIDNYNKLLITLSLEFLGDYQNARKLYNTINLTEQDIEQYKSIIAIIETFIDKENAVKRIDELIEENPADEYLRFAILSYLENSSNDIETQETVRIVGKNINETFTINGMEVKTYVINNEELEEIKFETENENLMVSYYYQTQLDEIESENIVNDVEISINGDLEKNNIVTLEIKLTQDIEGNIRIALPNSLRLIDKEYDYNEYYLTNNQIDYITIFKTKNCDTIEIPLIVTSGGNYVFENVIIQNNGIYHVSNSLELNINS